MASNLPACVVDVGTGYTKLGYAGNTEPQYIFPSTIAVKEKKGVGSTVQGVEDLDFFIGDDCKFKRMLRTVDCGLCCFDPAPSCDLALGRNAKYLARVAMSCA